MWYITAGLMENFTAGPLIKSVWKVYNYDYIVLFDYIRLIANLCIHCFNGLFCTMY